MKTAQTPTLWIFNHRNGEMTTIRSTAALPLTFLANFFLAISTGKDDCLQPHTIHAPLVYSACDDRNAPCQYVIQMERSPTWCMRLTVYPTKFVKISEV